MNKDKSDLTVCLLAMEDEYVIDRISRLEERVQAMERPVASTTFTNNAIISIFNNGQVILRNEQGGQVIQAVSEVASRDVAYPQYYSNQNWSAR